MLERSCYPEVAPPLEDSLQTLPSTRKIQIEVLEDAQMVGEAAASFVTKQVKAKPESVLLLPTGRTPLLMYFGLISRTNKGELDLSRVQTFNLDEFYGLAPKHPGSYHTYMHRVFFDYLPALPRKINLLDGSAIDVDKECAAYEAKIKTAGGIDLVVLGIGTNGHIGFNEPGSSFASRSRRVAIQPETRAANAFLFENCADNVPEAALTVGIATIMEARHVLLVATGSAKAQAVAAMLQGPITPDLPASFLQLHPDVTLLADREAASKLL